MENDCLPQAAANRKTGTLEESLRNVCGLERVKGILNIF
jgi:hypothetical protein